MKDVHVRKAVDPRSTRAGRSRGGMSGNPEREGGGGRGNLAARKPKIQIPSFRVSGAPPWIRGGTPKSRFHVSKCADSRILLCKFQIPSFRVSKIPRPLCRSAEGTQFPNSLFPRGQIPGYSSANSRFQDSECADSWILPGKFQIPSFQVSEAHSRVPSPRVPKFQFPSFRVSEAEAPSWVRSGGSHKLRVSEFPRPPLGPSPRDPQIPDSEFPSFRGPLYTDVLSQRWTPIFQNVIPRALYVRMAQIPEYREQFLFPLLYSWETRPLWGWHRMARDGTAS